MTLIASPLDQLIYHVDEPHLTDKSAIETASQWNPTPAEVASIVVEMRPIIDRFAARDRLRSAAQPASQGLLSALGGTRTPNLLIRSQMLSPIELRAQGQGSLGKPPSRVATRNSEVILGVAT